MGGITCFKMLMSVNDAQITVIYCMMGMDVDEQGGRRFGEFDRFNKFNALNGFNKYIDLKHVLQN